jgi:hypothetical protein
MELDNQRKFIIFAGICALLSIIIRLSCKLSKSQKSLESLSIRSDDRRHSESEFVNERSEDRNARAAMYSSGEKQTESRQNRQFNQPNFEIPLQYKSVPKPKTQRECEWVV